VVAHPRDQGDSRAARRLNEPRPARVEAPENVPTSVGGVAVSSVREEWRVFDRWWTAEPVRRRYFDVVLETGENMAVFYDFERQEWFRQKA
jgi:hypothetical protein